MKVLHDIMIVICTLKYLMYIIYEEYLVNNVRMPELGVYPLVRIIYPNAGIRSICFIVHI